ncbi:MAG: hypothetical protein JW940_35395 [Polyangiaceae bacterium]|nr:hypothetical protein [Polyangiaceae bacterium]
MADPSDGHETQRKAGADAGAAAGPNAAGSDIYSALSFERATPAASPAPTGGVDPSRHASAEATTDFTCRSCRARIDGEYFTINQQALCPRCREKVVRGLALAPGSFSRALGFGALAAAGGAAVYYAVAALTGYELGIIAIVVGVVVGKAVRRGAGTRSHWSYRALGLGLTWASISATYLPPILESMRGSAADAKALTVAFLFALFVPVLLCVKGEVMSLIILAIGLWEGWRFSAAPVISVEGPFRLGAGGART